MSGVCVVLHQHVPAAAPPDEQDVLTAAGEVRDALHAHGWRAETLAVTGDLAAARAALRQRAPDLVFNLVESLPGLGDAGALAASALLAGLDLRHTGCPPAAVALGADKPAMKRALRAAGIPTPAEAGDAARWIVKRVREHASQGLGPRSVVATRPATLAPGWFAEAFLPGREFNVALLDGPDGVEALPVAELQYAADWPADMPHILDYFGKWDPAHPLHGRTQRRYGTAAPALEAQLRGLALRCWPALGLAGYARVDLRLDADGVPHVLEVNPNPCLSADAGFVAAAAQAGLSQAALIARIADAAAGTDAPSRCARRARRESGPRRPAPALRGDLTPLDVGAIGALCAASGYFTAEEVAVAEELAGDRVSRGTASDYRFLVADDAAGIVGYACFGRVAGTDAAWDLYWIVVRPDAQGSGLGRDLVQATAAEAARAGGRRLYAETSGRALYAPTRGFYARAGFALQAVLPGFYGPGDDKQIWMRPIETG